MKFLGSRNLGGSKEDNDQRFVFEGLSQRMSEDDMDDNFVSVQRRFKERAAESFEEELAELRRKRRDLEVNIFKYDDIYVIGMVYLFNSILESETLNI